MSSFIKRVVVKSSATLLNAYRNSKSGVSTSFKNLSKDINEEAKHQTAVKVVEEKTCEFCDETDESGKSRYAFRDFANKA